MASEKAEVSREPALPKPAAIVWVEHKPTLDNAKCGACHDRNASFALLRPINVLCLQCHQATAREAPLMHGPVAVGECSLCHEAHRSPYPHLLKAPLPKLCFGCHDRTPPKYPRESPTISSDTLGGKPTTLGCLRPSDEAACTTCHRPHGGTDRFFLRGRAPAKP